MGVDRIVAHGYAGVDLARVREFLRTRLGDFNVFAGHVVRYLDSPR